MEPTSLHNWNEREKLYGRWTSAARGIKYISHPYEASFEISLAFIFYAQAFVLDVFGISSKSVLLCAVTDLGPSMRSSAPSKLHSPLPLRFQISSPSHIDVHSSMLIEHVSALSSAGRSIVQILSRPSFSFATHSKVFQAYFDTQIAFQHGRNSILVS